MDAATWRAVRVRALTAWTAAAAQPGPLLDAAVAAPDFDAARTAVAARFSIDDAAAEQILEMQFRRFTSEGRARVVAEIELLREVLG